MRAAAPLQRLRREEECAAGGRCHVRIHPEDLRFRWPKRDERLLIIFLVDASGSMVYNRIREAKGAVQRLLREAYCRRDKIAIITFRAGGSRLLLSPGRSVERASCAMDNLAVGGGTPLAAGIRAASDLARHIRRSEGRESLLVLLTDACANLTLAGEPATASGETVWQELEQVSTAAREVYDVTGAGDTVIATLGAALACGASMTDAALLANHAAGIVVGKVGTATATINEVLDSIE